MKGITGLVCGWTVLCASPAAGQGGGPHLFVLDLQGTALDEFPGAVKALNGVMTVVDKDGQHMLMASSPSELLITLPQALPAVFTIEVDLVPKACCNPDDFMVEGTPTRNRGAASAELTWHPEHVSAVGGGGDMYQSAVPADIAAAAPGNLTHLVIEVNGPTIKLWTNGRRLYTLDKQFVRGRVLRVWLGGESATNPMYLAGLRVGSGPATPSVIAAGAGLPGGGGPATQTVGTSQAATGGGRVVPNVTVTMGSGGPLVTWGLLGGVSSYTVKRWKLNDLICCNAASPALSGPPWQDVALTVAGTYVYEVTATNPGWTATGQAQFVQFKNPGQIATVAPSGTTAPTNPAVSSGVPTVSSGSAAPPNSAIKQFLPPPSRSITLGGFTGAGSSATVAARTIVLPALSAVGGNPRIASRTLTPGAFDGTGPVIVLNRTIAGLTGSAAPTSRTIALPAFLAAGVAALPLSRSVSLTGFMGVGATSLPARRTLTLTGWSAVGLFP